MYPRRQVFSAWSNNWQPSSLSSQINAQKPDVVNLHWIAGGFFSLRELSHFEAPVVWTLHDPWILTGGCHYPDQCRRFTGECGRCPQLGSERSHDLSWFNLRSKRRSLNSVDAFVTPSSWLAELSRSSGSLDVAKLHTIPYGLDGTVYRMGSIQASRRALDLPTEAVVIVAGAQHLGEKRKGCHFLGEAVGQIMREVRRPLIMLLFGSSDGSSLDRWDCEVRRMGTLTDEAQVAQLYNAADLLLLPSLQDNLPNVALEAQACGCPVVGFDTGGLREIIESGVTGAVTEDVSAAGLAVAALDWLRAHPERTRVAQDCRDRFERLFTYPLHARRMRQLYEHVTVADR